MIGVGIEPCIPELVARGLEYENGQRRTDSTLWMLMATSRRERDEQFYTMIVGQIAAGTNVQRKVCNAS